MRRLLVKRFRAARHDEDKREVEVDLETECGDATLVMSERESFRLAQGIDDSIPDGPSHLDVAS